MMKPGELFEIKCYEYLKTAYSGKKVIFQREGSMDSTKSDIAVIKNGNLDYFIEVKESLAQSGQFVLIPSEVNKKFSFSPRNRSEQNDMTKIIIGYMNQNFERFKGAGTAGKMLDIDSSVFADWIIGHYKERNVRYVISYSNDFVILPVEKFSEYFDITAKYRIKKSGSNKPSAKDVPLIKEMVANMYSDAEFISKENKLYVSFSHDIVQDKFKIGKYTYFLSKQDLGYYEIRRLSNTCNMNVIFSIRLKKSQDKNDLEKFEKDL